MDIVSARCRVHGRRTAQNGWRCLVYQAICRSFIAASSVLRWLRYWRVRRLSRRYFDNLNP